jgi:Origin of replication binding protein
MKKSDAFSYWESNKDSSKLYVYSDYYRYFAATKKEVIAQYPWKDLRMYECLDDCLGSTKLFFDIDGKSDASEELFIAQMAEFLSSVLAVCRKEFSMDAKFLVGRSPPKIKDGLLQFSYRVISEKGPRFQTRSDIIAFVSRLKEAINSPISANVDMQVYKGSHVRMMFATKPNESRIQMPTSILVDGTPTLMPSNFMASAYGLPAEYFKRCFVKSRKPGISFGSICATPNKQKVPTPTLSGSNYALTPLEKWLWCHSLQVQSAPSNVMIKLMPADKLDTSSRCSLCIVPDDATCLVDMTTVHSSPKSCAILLGDGRCFLKCFSPQHQKGRTTDETGGDGLATWYKYLKVWLQLSTPNDLAPSPLWITPVTVVDDPIFPNFSIGNPVDGWNDVLIRSNMKTSKSTSCRRLLQQLWSCHPSLRVIFVVHRRTLAWHLKEKCDSAFGPERVSLYMDTKNTISDSCIISVDSLHRLDTSVGCDILVLDEIESLVPQLFAGTVPIETKAKNAKVWNHLLMTSNSCIAMDAEFSEASEKMLRTLRPSKSVTFFVNVCRNWSDVRTTLVQTDAQLLGMMAADVASGKKVYACFGSRKFMRQRAVPILLEEMDSAKLMVYDSDTDNHIKEEHLRNVDNTWVNFDVILTTSTNHSGTSFEKTHFDVVYGFFGSAFNLSHEDMLQMMGRIRVVHQWNISIPFGSIKEVDVADMVPYNVDGSFSPFQHAELHTLWKSHIKQRQTPARLVSRLYQMGLQLTMASYMPPDSLIEVRRHLNELAAAIREEDAHKLRAETYLEDKAWDELIQSAKLGQCAHEQKYSLVANDAFRYYGISSFDGFDEKILCRPAAKQIFATRAIIDAYSFEGGVQWNDLLSRVKQEELHRQRLLPDTLYLKSIHPEWLVLSKVLQLIQAEKLWSLSGFKSWIYSQLIPLYRQIEEDINMKLFLHPKLFQDSNGKSLRRPIDEKFVSRKLPVNLVGKVLKKIGWKVTKTKTHVSIKEVSYPPFPKRTLAFWIKQIGYC